MPIFLVGKVWLFAMTVGVIFLFLKQSRRLSAHLLLGSTVGMILSFAGAVIASRVLGVATGRAHLVSMILGAVLGAVIGSCLALKVNQLLGIRA